MYESHPEEIEHITDWCTDLSFTPVKEIGHNAIRCRVPSTKRQLLWVSPRRDRTHHTVQQSMCITPKSSNTSHRSAGKSQIEPLSVRWGFEPTTSSIGGFAWTNWATELLMKSSEKTFTCCASFDRKKLGKDELLVVTLVAAMAPSSAKSL